MIRSNQEPPISYLSKGGYHWAKSCSGIMRNIYIRETLRHQEFNKIHPGARRGTPILNCNGASPAPSETNEIEKKEKKKREK
ncbi:hypothetical protein M8J75_013961 [Diaphorina citri]|nr:hypothetical protein M8J75_013961 [Diaphorina citri]